MFNCLGLASMLNSVFYLNFFEMFAYVKLIFNYICLKCKSLDAVYTLKSVLLSKKLLIVLSIFGSNSKFNCSGIVSIHKSEF